MTAVKSCGSDIMLEASTWLWLRSPWGPKGVYRPAASYTCAVRYRSAHRARSRRPDPNPDRFFELLGVEVLVDGREGSVDLR